MRGVKDGFIPEEFLKSMEALEGVDVEGFLASMTEAPATSIKLNRRKATTPEDIGYEEMKPVAWCRSGFYLSSRPKFTLNPLLHAGVFYVQDASSMIYETLVGTLLNRGLLPSQPIILDLCAAPGGKTTSIINALPDGSHIIANEVMPKRVQILAENLQKWGYPEIIVTNSSTEKFRSLPGAFDLVAVDAPCSGEGMMRKDEEARSQWSPRLVEQCARLQREILSDAVETVRPGGILIYSTCTFNRSENEGNVEWLVKEHGMEPIDPDAKAEWGIGREIASEHPALRFMPHLTRGEGLFVAMLRKPGDSPEASHKKTLDLLRKKTKVILDGIPTIEMKGKVEQPASQWVLSTDFPSARYPEAELDYETAIRYLRHEAIILNTNAPRGFVVVKYKGYPLGFVKNIGNRANNLFPAQWKIRLEPKI